jgi:hypothetical protein
MKRGILTVLILICFNGLCFSSDYLPKLKKGTIKTFKVINKKGSDSNSYSNSVKYLAERKLAGKNVYPWVWQNGYIQFGHIDKIGLCLFANQAPDDIEPQINKELYYFIKFPIKVGTTWQHKGKPYLLKFIKETNLDLTCTNRIESLDDIVTVPAGTFENCLKIKRWGKRVIEEEKPFWISVEMYEWYAPKVGWIKSITKHDTNHSLVGSSTERILLLTEFKVPK